MEKSQQKITELQAIFNEVSQLIKEELQPVKSNLKRNDGFSTKFKKKFKELLNYNNINNKQGGKLT